MKTLLSSSDLKNLLLPILALLAIIHALVPFLIATFGSAEYFQLQTLKLATSHEKLTMAYAEKELQLFTDRAKHKQDFALKIATLDAETTLKSMDLLFRHEFGLRNLTIFAPVIELEAASKHVLDMAKIEQETKRIWSKEWKEVDERKIELERYLERGVMLKKMLEKWAPGDFNGQGIIRRFMKEG